MNFLLLSALVIVAVRAYDKQDPIQGSGKPRTTTLYPNRRSLLNHMVLASAPDQSQRLSSMKVSSEKSLPDRTDSADTSVSDSENDGDGRALQSASTPTSPTSASTDSYSSSTNESGTMNSTSISVSDSQDGDYSPSDETRPSSSNDYSDSNDMYATQNGSYTSVESRLALSSASGLSNAMGRLILISFTALPFMLF